MCAKGKASVSITLEAKKYKTCQTVDLHGVSVTSSRPAWVLACVWHVREACFATSECLAAVLLELVHIKPSRK